MTLRRFGLAVFALALAAAAIQVPACEVDPTTGAPQAPSVNRVSAPEPAPAHS